MGRVARRAGDQLIVCFDIGFDIGAARTRPPVCREPNATADRGDVTSTVMDTGHSGDDRAEYVRERLTIPVLVAALVSVPAVFLAATPGLTGLIGRVLNWVSLSVLLGESLVLLWLSGSVRTWIRRYRAQLIIVGVTVPAVVFAVGPVQILRLLLAVGAFRILRVRRIVRAGHVIVRRTGLPGHRGRWVLVGVSLLAGVFATLVLIDPRSRSRRTLYWVTEHLGVGGTVVAALGVLTIMLAVTNLLRRDT